MADHPQRRRYPRVPSENAVLVTRLGEADLEAVSKTRVVGLGGCMFTAGEPFGIGALLRMLITVQQEVVECLARVAYEIPSADGYEIGVEFLLLPEAKQARIRSILADQDVTSDL
jgi:hypothetical protein